MRGLIPFVVALTVCWLALWSRRGDCQESATQAYNRIAHASMSRSNYDEQTRREVTSAQMAAQAKQLAKMARDNKKQEDA